MLLAVRRWARSYFALLRAVRVNVSSKRMLSGAVDIFLCSSCLLAFLLFCFALLCFVLGLLADPVFPDDSIRCRAGRKN